MREVRDLKQHYMTAMVFYRILILAPADILLIRMATVLPYLQRVEGIKTSMAQLAGAIEQIASALSGINDTVGESSVGVTDTAEKTSGMVEKTSSATDKVKECYQCVDELRDIVTKFT